MGCDGPAKKKHEFYIDGERIVTDTCPRKMMRPAGGFVKAYNWAEAGRLDHLYPPGTLPAFVAEAIDLIASEMSDIQKEEMEEARKRHG